MEPEENEPQQVIEAASETVEDVTQIPEWGKELQTTVATLSETVQGLLPANVEQESEGTESAEAKEVNDEEVIESDKTPISQPWTHKKLWGK